MGRQETIWLLHVLHCLHCIKNILSVVQLRTVKYQQAIWYKEKNKHIRCSFYFPNEKHHGKQYYYKQYYYEPCCHVFLLTGLPKVLEGELVSVVNSVPGVCFCILFQHFLQTENLYPCCSPGDIFLSKQRFSLQMPRYQPGSNSEMLVKISDFTHGC